MIFILLYEKGTESDKYNKLKQHFLSKLKWYRTGLVAVTTAAHFYSHPAHTHANKPTNLITADTTDR